jgi:hypothetical protein
MIRQKQAANYRRTSIALEGGLMKRCKYCAHKVLMTPYGYRCDIIGVEQPGRYAIEDSCVCDHWEYNHAQKR